MSLMKQMTKNQQMMLFAGVLLLSVPGIKGVLWGGFGFNISNMIVPLNGGSDLRNTNAKRRKIVLFVSLACLILGLGLIIGALASKSTSGYQSTSPNCPDCSVKTVESYGPYGSYGDEVPAFAPLYNNSEKSPTPDTPKSAEMVLPIEREIAAYSGNYINRSSSVTLKSPLQTTDGFTMIYGDVPINYVAESKITTSPYEDKLNLQQGIFGLDIKGPMMTNNSNQMKVGTKSFYV